VAAGLLRVAKVDWPFDVLVGIGVTLIALPFVVDWRRRQRVPSLAEIEAHRPRGQETLFPASRGVPSPDDPEADAQRVDRMRLQLNEDRVQRQVDRRSAERERRALIREGYELVARFEESDIRAIAADIRKLSPDLRKWARKARGFMVTEMSGVAGDLPEDDLLYGNTDEKYQLLKGYLKTLEAHPLA
jgi:hypothetical protein